MSEKIIVITGASAGIGAAAAEHLAGQGHSVAMVARRKNELDCVAAQGRGRGYAIVADVCDPSEVRRVVETRSRGSGASMSGSTTLAKVSRGTHRS